MKNLVKLVLPAALLLFVSPSTNAASIGVQFSGSGSSLMNIILTPGESAGALPQTNWNVIRTVGGEAEAAIVNDISGELKDGAGNLTAVKLQYGGGDDSWRLSNTAGLASNLKLMSGELKTHGSMTLTWSGLSAGSYEVYLYGAVDGGAATLSVSVDAGVTTYYWTEPTSNAQPFTEAAHSTDSGNPGVGNYMHFMGLSPVSGVITITVNYVSGNGAEAAVGITGLQLVSPSDFPAGTTAPPTYAAKIGVEFSGGNRGAATVLAPGETAGYIVQPNWNVVTTANGDVSQGTALYLRDNATNFTTVALQYSGNDSWSTRAGRFSTDDRLMKGYLADDGAGSISLTFTNLGAGSYDIYLYGNVLDGPTTLSVNVAGTTYYWSEPSAFNGFFKQAALSTDSGNPGAGNYLRLSGVSPVSGAITITSIYISGSEAGISGLQLCSSTAFPLANATILPEPTSQVALIGNTATFVSGAFGPAPVSYQWQTNSGSGWVNVVNGGRISGATTNTLTIANVGSADAISYRLIATDAAANSATSSVVRLSVVSEALAVDFSGDDSSQGNITARKLAAAAVAGVLPQAQWNWINNAGGGAGEGISGTSVPLNNHQATATLVRLIYEGNDAWFCNAGEITSNDGKMMKGVLKHEGADPGVTLTFTNLGAGGSYDVFLYGNNSDGPVVMSVAVGANTYYWNLAQNFFGTFIEAPLTNDVSYPSSGNYMHLTGLSPDANGTITLTCAYVSGTTYIGIAGIQIVKPTGVFSRTPVSITAQPTPSVLYAGGTVTFSVEGVSGYTPLSYQWQVNTGSGFVNVVNDSRISGATSSTLTIANVGAADAFSYRVIVTDAAPNSATSSVATLTIAAPPAAGSYAAMVLAGNPLAYYRLNETSGTNVYDFVGDHNGSYKVNATLGLAGVPNPPYLGFEATNVCFQSSAAFPQNSYALTPFGTLAGRSNVTFTMWIYPNAPQGGGSAGLIVDRTGGGGGGGFMYSTSGANLAYQWNTNTASGDIITTMFDSGLAVPVGQWSFCALVIAPSGATLYLYNANGLTSTNDPTPLVAQTFGNGWHLGQDVNDANPFKAFDGLIDEVAIYGSSLSADQINRLYLAATSGLPEGISIARSGQNVVLTWSQGVLLQAPAVTGPWTTNSAATSPYTNAAAGSQFYRLLMPVVP